MRVLLVQHGIFPGYVGPVAKEWAKNLWALGVDVAVVTLGTKSPPVPTEPLNFPVYAIESTNIFQIYRELKGHLKDRDVVHYFPGKGLELMPLLNLRAKYIFNHISVSVTGKFARDRLIDAGKRVQPLFADHILYTDQPLSDALRPVRGTPTSLMPVGFPSDLFYPCPPPGPLEKKILIYHGAVRPQRRLDLLIQVLSRLPEEYSLTIIGGGLPGDESYREYLAECAQQLQCTDRVNLTNMPQSLIRAEIEKAYLCLSYVPMLDCYQEQFVIKTLEYLACQRPVLATATRYTARFSESIGGRSILLTDGTDADMIEKILNADEYVRNFYSRENLDALPSAVAPYSSRYLVENRLLPIYKGLLAKNGNRNGGDPGLVSPR